MKIKFLSAVVATTIAATTLTAFAGAITQDENYYYINDDFSNYTYVATTSSNDDISNWRIEYGDNASASAAVTKSSLDTRLTDALKIASDASKTFRGGRLFGKTIGAGENLTVEFDLYADNTTTFALGFEADTTSGSIEDTLGAISFAVTGDDGKVYAESLQRNYLSGAKQAYSGLTYVPGEVNHVKINYALNSSLEDDTKDTVTVTLSNSVDSNQTAALDINFRSTVDSNFASYKIDGIVGVNFTKSAAGDLYIDNFKAYQTGTGNYQEYALINMNCDNAVNDTTKQANNFYLENGNNAAAASGVFTTTTGKDGTANGAVKITPGTTVYAHRGVIPFENVIQPEGKTLKLSFDIKAPSFTAESGNGNQFVMGFVSNTAKEDRRAAAPFAIGTQATAGALDIKYGDNANRQNLGNLAWGLSLEPSVWNHVEIEYTFATDMDSYTLGSWGGSAWNDTTTVGTPVSDSVTLSVTNSSGAKKTATKNIASRAHGAANGCQLTEIYGLGIYAAQSTTFAYELDNIKVVAEDVATPTATIEKTSDTTVTVTFSEEMSDKYSKLDGITVKNGAETVEMTGALAADKKTYTLTSATPLAAGDYTVTVPASVISLVGVPMKAAATHDFNIDQTKSFTLEQNGQTVDTLSSGAVKVKVALDKATKDTLNGKKVMLMVVEYAKGGCMQKAWSSEVDAAYNMEADFTLGDAAAYKAFVWRADNVAPIFNAK